MELRQLHYFMEVAERERVSEAAMHLHVAQSAISRQIANLEEELGVDLFEREGRNVKLTPIGRQFLDHIKTAMKAIDFAKEQIDEYLDPNRGTVKIGFPTSLAGQFLPTVISAFKEEHPHVAFLLRQGSYKFLIEAVKNRDIDLAFLGQISLRLKGTFCFRKAFWHSCRSIIPYQASKAFISAISEMISMCCFQTDTSFEKWLLMHASK